MKNRSSVITGGKGICKREEYDFYATPLEATELFLQYHKLQDGLTFLEPACGRLNGWTMKLQNLDRAGQFMATSMKILNCWRNKHDYKLWFVRRIERIITL